MQNNAFLGRPTLTAVGIMTGNSMDGIDVVLTEFKPDGSIRDIESHSESFPAGLADHLRTFRSCLNDTGFDLSKAETTLAGNLNRADALDDIHRRYVEACATTVKNLIVKAQRTQSFTGSVDIVGFHGQTVGHFPPSIARSKGGEPFTIQMGDGQLLADLLNIPVAYDFRSDDIVLGGEGAPLAPMHHRHLADDTRKRGLFPIAFINAGNTGNISVITKEGGDDVIRVVGWDTGPFNHFPDLLARRELQKDQDEDGAVGKTGTVNIDLLQSLFEGGAVTKDGQNFLVQTPPRSSDPQWYRELPELLGTALSAGKAVSLPDRLRTAEYFAAYVVMYSLTLLPPGLVLPHNFALCGGGWKNPLIFDHFKALLTGDQAMSPILEGHKEAFQRIRTALSGKALQCDHSTSFGYDGGAMEARIFADAAVCRITGTPFTLPETTAVAKPCMCGVVRFPRQEKSAQLLQEMTTHGTLEFPDVVITASDKRFGRAVPGWQASNPKAP